MMGYYSLDFFTTLKRENLQAVILPYGFSAAVPTLPTRIYKTTKTHIEYILTESLTDDESFVFDCPHKTDLFGCSLFTDITVEKLSRIIFHRFDRKKHDKIVFCKTLSDLAWSEVYQCSTPSDMFGMFANLFSGAVEKHALLRKIFLKEKLPKILKETWFNDVWEKFLAEYQVAYERHRQNSSAKNLSAFSRSRLKLVIVMKDEQESIS